MQFDEETNSLYALYPGNHASKSYFFDAASFNSPETRFITLYGNLSDS